MRTLWNALTFFAVVNVLALLLVVAWLWQTGRLSRERAMDIRAMLSTTVRDASEQAKELASEREAARLQEQLETARQHPPTDSATQIAQVTLVHRESRQALERLENERRMLGEQLDEAARNVETLSEQWRRETQEAHEDRATDAHRRSQEQFLRAVRQLEQIPPKQAKGVLQTLVAENNIEQAVAYLDSLNARAAAKILREFKSEQEIVLATELLERLRTRGVDAAIEASSLPADPANADSAQGDNSGYASSGTAGGT